MYLHLLPLTSAGRRTLHDGVSSRWGPLLKRAAICLSLRSFSWHPRCRGVGLSSTLRDKRVSEEKKTTSANLTKSRQDQRGSHDHSSALKNAMKLQENMKIRSDESQWFVLLEGKRQNQSRPGISLDLMRVGCVNTDWGQKSQQYRWKDTPPNDVTMLTSAS